MKEIPMIFNSNMAEALVAGRKTVTRRPIKLETVDKGFMCKLKPNEVAGEVNNFDYDNSPYKPGDLIWVRETFRQFNSSYECGCSESPCNCPCDGAYLYKAGSWTEEGKWKPSIHMPRRASRLTLLITDVRCELVKDISRESAINEGLIEKQHKFSSMSYPLNDIGYMASENSEFIYSDPEFAFKEIWNSIYGNWDKNPWVFVIEFEVIHKNIDEVLK